MDSKTRLLLLCSLPLLLNACASKQAPQENEDIIWKEKIEHRLDSMSAVIQVVDENEELAKLQARISLLEAENKRESLDTQNQFVAISTQLETLKQELKGLKSHFAKLKKKTVEKLQKKSVKKLQKKPGAVIVDAPKAGNKSKPQPRAQSANQRQNERARRAYYDAYFALKNGDYFEASLAFRNFLRDFPETKLVDEAKYWHGESLLAQGDVVKALEVFKNIIKEKSTTTRHAAAMLKAGLIYEEQNKKEEATSLYNSLVRQHPASSEAETARTRLKQKSGYD